MDKTLTRQFKKIVKKVDVATMWGNVTKSYSHTEIISNPNMKEIISKEHIQDLKEYIEASDKLGFLYSIIKKNI